MVPKFEGERDEIKGLVEMMLERTALHGRRDDISKVGGRLQGQYHRNEIPYGGDID